MLPYKDIVTILCERDAVLDKAIATLSEEIKPTPSVDIYWYLLNSIASQQLSVKVVRVIWNRFLDLFPNAYPGADTLLAIDNEVLRGVGLSNSKVKYMKNVAQFSLDNDISFEYLSRLSDEEIIAHLTQIKGVGKWTVQMVLMFPMDRPDVFPVDDLGIQTAMKYWYGIDAEKKMLRDKMMELAEKWSPYRSLASKCLWESNRI